jgi:pimeloyl-ACP methyl ester carboxylesterase
LRLLRAEPEHLTTPDDRRLAYRRTGRGQVLVCHPGGPGFSSRYLGDLAGLGADFTLVMLDPRGTGGSDRPADPHRYLIDDYVGDLEALRVELGLERILLLGHSHGGMVAMAYAAAYPDRVQQLVLANTAARFGAEQQAAMRAGMEERSSEPWYPDAEAALMTEQAGEFDTDEELTDLALRELPFYFARYDARAAAYLDGLREDAFNGDALRLFNKEIFGTIDLRAELAHITAPTFVITGDADFITGPVCALELAEGISNVRPVIVEGSGHMLFFEDPARFRAEVRAFVGGSALLA